MNNPLMSEKQAKEIIAESKQLYIDNIDKNGKLPPQVVGEISRNQILLVSAGVCTDEEFVQGVRAGKR